MFQFLIGTLKTACPKCGTVKLNQVSIPDRYAKNYIGDSKLSDNTIVSIPDRYAKNRQRVDIILGRKKCFNS